MMVMPPTRTSSAPARFARRRSCSVTLTPRRSPDRARHNNVNTVPVNIKYSSWLRNAGSDTMLLPTLLLSLAVTENFLGIVVLTTPQSVEKRKGVRDTWLTAAKQQPGIEARFFLAKQEDTAEMAAESAANGRDIVVLDALTNAGYEALIKKVHAAFAWFVSNRPSRFIFKTDDDVWVNVPQLYVDLGEICRGKPLDDSHTASYKSLRAPPACVGSARFLYAGAPVPNRTMVTEPNLKYSNVPMHRDTGFKQYPHYFGGPGYVVSGALAKVITRVGADQPPLQFWPREDATMAMWLLPYNVTRLSAGGRVEFNSARKVFTAVSRPPGSPTGNRAPFAVKFDVCKRTVWAVHRLQAWQAELLNKRLTQCALAAEVGAALHRMAGERLASARGGGLSVMEAELRKARGPPALSLFGSLFGSLRGPASEPAGLEAPLLLTPPSPYHFFGYFDKSPWSRDGSRLLAHEAPFFDRDMKIDDALTLLARGPDGTWAAFDTTRAWNFQQGAMLQWLGASSERVVFNDRHPSDPARLIGVLANVATKTRERTFDRPFYALSHDGRLAASLDFLWLHQTRIGYGYTLEGSGSTWNRPDRGPMTADGLWLTDLDSGASRLAVSLHDVYCAALLTQAPNATDAASGLPYGTQLGTPFALGAAGTTHWLNHAQFNRQGTQLTFLYRVMPPVNPKYPSAKRRHFTSQWVVDVTGGNLWRLPLVRGSHHDFGWANKLLVCDDTGMYEANTARHTVRNLGKKWWSQKDYGDGHCSYSPIDQRVILHDTYPRLRKGHAQPVKRLMVWHRGRGKNPTTLGYFAPHAEGPVHTRSDLHPRWSPDASAICFDSTHGSHGRQMYVLSTPLHARSHDPRLTTTVAASKVPASKTAAAPTRRKVFLDIGSQNGDSVETFAAAHPSDFAQYEVHAFEANPQNKPKMDAFLARHKDWTNVKVHQPLAAWVENTTLSFRTDKRARTTGGSLLDSPYAKGAVIKVKALDLAAWLLKQFGQPAGADPRTTLELRAKLDIEGAEFDILPRLFKSGAIALFTELNVEWHDGFRKDLWLWPAQYEAALAELGVEYQAHT